VIENGGRRPAARYSYLEPFDRLPKSCYKATTEEAGMKTLWVSMAIGLVAGLIDIAPMVAQKMDHRAIYSAFLQYFFVSIIIVNIDLPGIVWWLQGSLIALALAVPIIIIVSVSDKKAIPIIAAMSVVLGACIGLAGYFFR